MLACAFSAFAAFLAIDKTVGNPGLMLKRGFAGGQFVMTASVKGHLHNLARAALLGRYPILLQASTHHLLKFFSRSAFARLLALLWVFLSVHAISCMTYSHQAGMWWGSVDV